MQAGEPLGRFLDYCTYGHMIDNVVLIVTGTLHERDVQVGAGLAVGLDSRGVLLQGLERSLSPPRCTSVTCRCGAGGWAAVGFVAVGRQARGPASSAVVCVPLRPTLARPPTRIASCPCLKNSWLLLSFPRPPKQELLEKCNPLGLFDAIASLAVAQNMRDLYRLVLVSVPPGTGAYCLTCHIPSSKEPSSFVASLTRRRWAVANAWVHGSVWQPPAGC